MIASFHWLTIWLRYCFFHVMASGPRAFHQSTFPRLCPRMLGSGPQPFMGSRRLISWWSGETVNCCNGVCTKPFIGSSWLVTWWIGEMETRWHDLLVSVQAFIGLNWLVNCWIELIKRWIEELAVLNVEALTGSKRLVNRWTKLLVWCA